MTNLVGTDSPNTCGFRPHYMFGIVGVNFWLQSAAQDATVMLTRFQITPEQITNLMAENDQNRDAFEVSCEWVKNNTEIWIEWLPEEQYMRPTEISNSNNSRGNYDAEMALIVTEPHISHSNTFSRITY